MGDVKIRVLLFEELERPFLDPPGNPVVRCLTAGSVAYAFVAFFPDPLDHPSDLSVTQADMACYFYLRHLLV
jgi:hypothetical protein